MFNPMINEINEMANQNQVVEPVKKSAHITSLALAYALTATAGAKDLLAVADSKAASVKKTTPVDPANTDTPDYVTQLMKLIAALDPNDPQTAVNLLNFVITLSQQGILSSSTPVGKELIDLLQGMNITKMLFVIDNAAAIAFYDAANKPNQTPAQAIAAGIAAALAFLNQMQQLLNGVPPKDSNSFIQAIQAEVTKLLNAFNTKNFMPSGFYLDPITGDLMYLSPITGAHYDLTNPKNDEGDPSVIPYIIGGEGSAGYWGSFDLSKLESIYMLDTLDAMIKQYGTGAIMMIIAYILNAKDQMFQGQLSDYADTTNDLDDLTNQYITPLETLWANVGNWTPADAATFFKDLTAATEIIGSNPSMQGFSSTWMTSVFGQITGTNVTWTDSSGKTHTDTIANLLKTIGQPGGPTAAQFTAAINALNPLPSGTTPPSPNPAYQMINNALMEGGGLVTQQSKMIGTLAAAVSNMDDQCIKLFSGFVDKSGSGLVALMFNIINNFKSS